MIQDYYDAFNNGDRGRMLALLTDDVAHDVNQGGRETGRDAFRRFLAHMDRCYRERLLDIVIMAAPMAAGCRRVRGRGAYLATDAGLPPARGQTYRLPAATFFELARGRSRG